MAALLLSTAPVHAQQDTGNAESGNAKPIVKIEIEGNDKTVEEVINQEILIEEGKMTSEQEIEDSRQNIMNLGLFRSVKVDSKETPEGVEVTFIVDEKRFWYLVPVFSRGSDGDVTYGARLQMDNLFGKNNELTLRAKRKEFQDTDLQTEQTYEIDYYYPRAFGSDYDFGFNVDFDEADIEEKRGVLEGDYLREKVSFGIRTAKWITTTGPSSGLRFKLGFLSEDFDHEFLRGDPNLFSDLAVNTIRPGLEYVDIKDEGTYRTGRNYGVDIGYASRVWGSDVSHLEYDIYYREYRTLNPVKKTNLNFQLRFGLITSSVFGNETYQVTGGTTVRGYERDSIEGDSFYIANVEYLRPIFGKDTVRGAVFLDAGDAFHDFKDFSFDDPKFGVGAGIRWKIRSFVRTDIRLDIAQGLGENGELKVYAGTRATF